MPSTRSGSPSSLSRLALLALGLLFVLACGGAAGTPSDPKPSGAANTVAAADGTTSLAGLAADPGPIPVGPDDPTWGSATAPLTLVIFSDFQCPFCARHAQNVDELKRIYGPETLRVVYKHNPLEFHDDALGAAAVGAAVHQLAGDAAFWAYHDTIYAPGADLRQMGPLVERAIRAAGRVAPLSVEEVVATARERGATKAGADLDLGARLGVRGTPASYLNGIFISGAQPVAELRAVLDRELGEAKSALARGLSPAAIYAERARENAPRPVEPLEALAKAQADAEEAPSVDATVWNVPVGASPSRGPATAQVTIVTFSDLECPFCAKLAGTLTELERAYSGKLRFVFKHRPLPFHKSARPASELLARIHAARGSDAFWRAHDEIFDGWSPSKLDEASLDALATRAGVPPRGRVAPGELSRHARTVELDEQLADDVEARGTPQSFVNGRRISGAQPAEAFRRVIDEELAKSEGLLRSGVPAAELYETLTRGGKSAFPPPRVELRPADAHTARRGLAAAPVRVAVFTDFECPFCKKHAATLDELEKEFRGRIRLELRHTPLPFHPHAHAAASLALEARRQKGDTGFWKAHDLLFAEARSLDRAGLVDKAQALGLDVGAVTRALDTNAYATELQTDAALARELGFDGTPITVVNGYVLEGAVSIDKLRRVVLLALDEARPAKKR